jgi:hypothetical protein
LVIGAGAGAGVVESADFVSALDRFLLSEPEVEGEFLTVPTPPV